MGDVSWRIEWNNRRWLAEGTVTPVGIRGDTAAQGKCWRTRWIFFHPN
jgi:hypothetical protein